MTNLTAVIVALLVLLVKLAALAYVSKTNAEPVLLHVQKVRDVAVHLQI
jgi:hypothetical protein